MPTKHQKIFTLIVISIFIFILAFVFKLIFLQGKKYKTLSDANRVRKSQIYAKRGAITDKNGGILVQDVITKDKKYTRKYEVGDAFGHILGYVANDQSTSSSQSKRCDTNDNAGGVKRIGVGGVEEIFQCELEGKGGVIFQEVNASEKQSKFLEAIPAQNGDDIKLTIDSALQQKTLKSFGDIAGAAIVLDAKSSEVLAIVSSPSFSPEKIGVDEKLTQKYLSDKKQPLFNRAIHGAYPPGSVFKMVVAAAALEEGKVKVNETISDTGYRMVGGKRYSNWLYTEYAGRTDGEVDMIKSLKRSNDIYYYEMGERLGVDKLTKYAHIFGFGQRTGIELDDVAGLVPSSFWKEEKVGDKWFLGDTYNYAIGQGYLLATPLQIALMTEIVANDGNICSPTILSSDTREELAQKSRYCKKIPVKKDVFETIKTGMKEACSIKGTAWTFFDLNSPDVSTTSAAFVHYKNPMQVGCKTGTAEHYVEGNEEPHGWLTLFAPAENPKIIVTVLAEKGGQGSDSAGPIARHILDEAISLGYVR